MKMQDVQRHQSERVSEIEEEERRKSEALRLKAIEQKQEQEDEIKRLNEVTLTLSFNYMLNRALVWKRLGQI